MLRVPSSGCKQAPRTAGALAALALAITGCTGSVGPCDDPRNGQDTVLSGGVVQYGGQAILNSACATGCHASTAKGAARNGAPVGLDFDLHPLGEEDSNQTLVRGGATVLAFDAEKLAGLRSRQRSVFEHRERIWQQVREEQMPPDGKFAPFRILRSILKTAEATPCTPYARLAPITEKASMDVLRQWLACGAPVVEANGPSVSQAGVFGTTGSQYQSCESEGDGGDAGVVTLETVQAQVFDTACAACHPALNAGRFKIDLTDAIKSYATLVEDTADQCEGKPYVMPGAPEQSFLYEIVAEEDPTCSQRMPQGGTLKTSQIELIRKWIAGGALRESDVQKRLDPLQGGLDAGL